MFDRGAASCKESFLITGKGKSKMKRSLMLFAMFLLTSAAWTFAQEAETVDHVTDDNVIVLQNGNAYQSDDATSQTWNTGDDVLVLDDDKIVNKDQDEAVDVTPTTVPDEDDPNEGDPQ